MYFLGFGTAYADYYLLSSSEIYSTIMAELEEKVYLSKAVIELLAEDDSAKKEDLLTKLQTTVMPSGERVSEDSLLRYAQVVCDRVYRFDQTGSEDDSAVWHHACLSQSYSQGHKTRTQSKESCLVLSYYDASDVAHL